jgi:hypothetical protein
VVAARAPLTADQLARATGIDAEEKLPRLLRKLSAFLPEHEGCYTLYHQSLLDWLTAEERRGDDYFISRKRGQERLAELCWQEFLRGPRGLSAYSLRHLPAHLAEAGRHDELCRLLSDFAFLEARAEAGLTAELAHDLSEAARQVPGFLDRFLGVLGVGRPGLASLRPEQQARLAEWLQSTHLPDLLKEAAGIYALLYRQTSEAGYLRKQAWVCYHGLDDWAAARQALTDCLEHYRRHGQEQEVESALAARLLAGILHDEGEQEDDPRRLIEERCLPVFERPGLELERGRSLEAIGIILDAESYWEESITYYDRAEALYGTDPLGLGRVHLNRSVARLFTSGVASALRELECIPRHGQAAGAIQLLDYYHANRCLYALLANDRALYDESAGQFRSEEKWASLSFRESAAVRTWFEGDLEAALGEMRQLADEFERLGDAWGKIDNTLNAGFLLLGTGQHERAAVCLGEALKMSRQQRYRAGAGLAAEGLRRLGLSSDLAEELAVYGRYLGHLFERCPSPFALCYLLLFP